jgi:hypothetical protein
MKAFPVLRTWIDVQLSTLKRPGWYKNADQAIILPTMAMPPHRMTMPPIHRARVVTEWFDEHENDVNHMPWPSQSPDPAWSRRIDLT